MPVWHAFKAEEPIRPVRPKQLVVTQPLFPFCLGGDATWQKEVSNCCIQILASLCATGSSRRDGDEMVVGKLSAIYNAPQEGPDSADYMPFSAFGPWPHTTKNCLIHCWLPCMGRARQTKMRSSK